MDLKLPRAKIELAVAIKPYYEKKPMQLIGTNLRNNYHKPCIDMKKRGHDE